MQLSRRLSLIASMVDRTGVVADVGTDHGYIPIYLVGEGIAQTAIAMDINSGPLARAEINIKNNGLEDRISIRLSDGVKELKSGEADAIVVAGMGGQLIIKILEDGEEVFRNAGQIILSPHSDIEMVRRYLCKMEYNICDESMVIDDNKYYNVIKILNNNYKSCDYSRDEDFVYGKRLLDKRDAVLKKFLYKEEITTNDILKNIKTYNSEKTAYLSKKLDIIRKCKGFYT